MIYVPARNRDWLEQPKEATVRVLGAVGKPGRYRFNDSMTLLDLLAEAGGPKDNAHLERIAVVNVACCADRARVFDLLTFSRTGDLSMLPVVRAGDTVFVPNVEHSKIAVAMRGINNAVSVLSLLRLLTQM